MFGKLYGNCIVGILEVWTSVTGIVELPIQYAGHLRKENKKWHSITLGLSYNHKIGLTLILYTPVTFG